MPADLTNPFGPSCRDGGECTTTDKSALTCGCDPGINYIAPFCWKHKPRNLPPASAPESIARSASGLQLDDKEDA